MKIISILYAVFLNVTYAFVILPKQTTNTIHYAKMRNISPIYRPASENQKSYLEKMENNEIVVAVGPAGTGKTLFACSHAVQQLNKRNVDKIIITRPLVTVEEDLGYLPGKLESKMEPWTRPIFDILQEYYDQRTIMQMMQSGVIEIAPLAYMRGRTFKKSIIIADEMQNSSPNQMLMITTRLSSNSQLIITGDLKQSDRVENNGMKDLLRKMDVYAKYNEINNIERIVFDETDVQRSKIVGQILNIYNFDENAHNKQKKVLKKESSNIVNNNDDAALIPLKDVKKLNRKK